MRLGRLGPMVTVALLCMFGDLQAGAQVHQGVPPVELWGFERATHELTFANDIWGRVEFHASRKKVFASWRHDSAHGVSQEIATSYYPTAVIALSNTRWCVAGKRERGATVVEVWTIQQPQLLLPLQGGGSAAIRPAIVKEIDTPYDEATPGRDMISLLCGKREDAGRILIQFWDSKDLYELDLASEEYTRIASPSPVEGVLHVAALNQAYAQFWAREHVVRGNIYVLADAGTPRPSLVLQDTDKDGLIDGWVLADADLWAQEFSTPSNYVR